MQERLWLGWTRWTWMRLAYAVIVVVAMVGLYWNARTSNRLAQEIVDRQLDQCIAANETRAAIVDFLGDLVAPRGVTPDEQHVLDLAHARLAPISCVPPPKVPQPK